MGTEQRKGEDDVDTRLYEKILKGKQTEKEMEFFSEAMRTTCEQTFKKKKIRQEMHHRKTNHYLG